MAFAINTVAAEHAELDVVATRPAETTGAVSWAAVILGALVATAISLILLLLGSGLGLVSSWHASGASAVAQPLTPRQPRDTLLSSFSRQQAELKWTLFALSVPRWHPEQRPG